MGAAPKGRAGTLDDKQAVAPTLDGASFDAAASGSVPVVVRAPHIGRFAIIREIGAGGMGSVFAAYDEQLDRKVALKILKKGDRGGQQLLTLREARAAARISHPNVISVYEVGEADGHIHIAMEYVEGGTLLTWQGQGGRHWREILSMYQQAGEALLAAHEADVVHRDFKPDNVLVGADGRPRVVDFGLARVGWVQSQPEVLTTTGSGETRDDTRHSGRLTLPGVISGTPGYMSPEQYRGGDVDSRSDQWSFCAALFEALYGYLPFSGNSVLEHAENVHGPPRPPPASTTVPEEVHRALVRGLSVDPARRFPSMAELLTILAQEQREDASAGALSRIRFSGAIVIGAVSSVVFFQLRQFRRENTPREAMVASLVMLVIALAAGLWRRRTVLRLRFHRTFWIVVVVTMLENLLQRFVAWRLGIPMPRLFPFEMIVLAGSCTILAATLIRWLAFLPLIPIAAAILATTGWIQTSVLAFAYSLVVILVSIGWSRAAKTVARSAADADAGGTGSGSKSVRQRRISSRPSDRDPTHP